MVMRRWIRRARQIMIIGGAIGYAFVSYKVNAAVHPTLLGVVFAFVPLLVIGLVVAWNMPWRLVGLIVYGFMVGIAWGARHFFFTHAAWAYLLQDVGAFVFLIWVFGRSLRRGRVSIITELAALVHGPLSPALEYYTRRVTQLWLVVFVGISITSVTLFFLAPRPLWSIFTNIMTTPILVLVFIGEYLVRRWLLPKEDCVSLKDTLQACYRYFGHSRHSVATSSDTRPH